MTARRPRAAAAALAVLLLFAGAAAGSELSDDLQARRARVMERLGPDAMLLVWSAPVQRYSADVNYEYRQDSNLYYLTGLTEDGTMLVLMPGNAAAREILFVRDRDPVEEHWHGRRLSAAEAAAATGIDTVLASSRFEPFVAAMLAGQPYGPVTTAAGARYFAAVAAGRARLAIVNDNGRGSADGPRPAVEFAGRLQQRFRAVQVVDATPIFEDLRTIKTPYERRLLTRSLEISSEAQRAGMRAARPGAYEYEVKAAIEAVHRARGAVSWSYPSIVASGPHATVLHYPGGDRRMQAGDLLLVDAACNYGYMSGDITRTYPVGGRFSPSQRELYELVLRAQQAGIEAAARQGATLASIHAATVAVIKAGLLALGLITNVDGDQYKIWYTHAGTHYIGIDVHDPGDRTRPLVPGMAFTIEPGLYIRQSALDALPATPENAAFIERVRPAVQKYLDLGVRIEDSFLLDEAGLRDLSAGVPKTIDEIEAFLARRPASSDDEGR